MLRVALLLVALLGFAAPALAQPEPPGAPARPVPPVDRAEPLPEGTEPSAAEGAPAQSPPPDKAVGDEGAAPGRSPEIFVPSQEVAPGAIVAFPADI